MNNHKHIDNLCSNLIAAVVDKRPAEMQKRFEELESYYHNDFGNRLEGYEDVLSFCKLVLAANRYLAYNNMFANVHRNYEDAKSRCEGYISCMKPSEEQRLELGKVLSEIESIANATPRRHRNLVIGRCDTRCCLCRTLPANKTGSHMVPNFLSHPSFSWDGKGKRDHEALDHSFLNNGEKFCSYYGKEVPEWRFAMGQRKSEVSDKDIENNVNQLEYDNEFCSVCEKRFGVLESAYSPFYSGQKKFISPRVAYLFWLSVLWRMSLGSMSIFMDMKDELPLRKLLDENILDTEKLIAESGTDLGEWKYAIFKASGLWPADKGIMGYRAEHAPYVVSYNDLVMVFFNHKPTDAELTIGPITVDRDKLCDWHTPEKYEAVDRRWFWDVRDWFVASSYEYYDPPRENALRIIREEERSSERIIDDELKDMLIKARRLVEGPSTQRRFVFHKFERIGVAWFKLQAAIKNGTSYDPLADEELFLTEKDFSLYYTDLAKYARYNGLETAEKFPFYEEAMKAMKKCGFQVS